MRRLGIRWPYETDPTQATGHVRGTTSRLYPGCIIGN